MTKERLPNAVERYIEGCIKSGKQLEAIRIYLEHYPSGGLAEATRAIEEREWQIESQESCSNEGEQQLQQWGAEYYDDYDEDESEENFDQGEGDIIVTNPKCPRKVLRILSIIFLVRGAFRLLLSIAALISGYPEVMSLLLGAGVFSLTFWKMFGILAKSEKGTPSVCLRGKNIKKPVFIIICIALASIFFVVLTITTALVILINEV